MRTRKPRNGGHPGNAPAAGGGRTACSPLHHHHRC